MAKCTKEENYLKFSTFWFAEKCVGTFQNSFFLTFDKTFKNATLR